MESSENQDLTQLTDLDPDRNFLENGSCQYYTSLHMDNDITNNPYSILHVNMRSCKANQQELENYLHLSSIDFSVIAMTETWLSDDEANLFNITNYNHFSSSRQDKRGGGVSVHIAETSHCVQRPDISNSLNSDIIESIFVESDFNLIKYIIGVIYRPPSSSLQTFLEQMNQLLGILKQEGKLIYLIGDFNIDLAKYDSNETISDFFNLMYSHSYKSLINKPTRVQGHSSSIIDNIFTNDLESTHSSGILLADISDHFPIFTLKSCNSDSKNEHRIKYRQLSENNQEKFLNCLEREQWQIVFAHSDAQKAYTSFSELLSNHYNQCFPLIERKRTKRDNNKWITTGLRTSIKQKNKLYVKYKRIPSVYNEIVYKRYRKKLQLLIVAAKKLHYQSLLNQFKNNSKKVWETIKEVIGKQNSKTEIQSISANGRTVTDKSQIASTLNKYFVSVGPNLDTDIPEAEVTPLHYLRGNYINSIFLTPVDTEEVLSNLRNLKDSSSGHDDYKPKIIKRAAAFLAAPLVHIINISFQTGVVPDELKYAHITPIFKSGDHNLPQNYRPISVLPVFSKVFERLLYNRLYTFLQAHNVITEYQYGFQSGYSTEMALIHTIEEISSKLDKGEKVIGLFLDLKKAFDTVNIEILLLKLNHYGVRGKSLDLIKNYLTNRKQAVIVDDCKSEQLYTTCGVPQGSILGPLLFLIYVNDLCNALKKTFPIMYADDTNIFLSGQNVEEMTVIFNSEMKQLNQWFRANRLSLNLKKTHALLFSLNRSDGSQNLAIEFDDCPIETLDKTTFLGVRINRHLDWKNHIQYINNKIAKSTGILKKLSRVFNQQTLRMLYFSLIYPYLTYCNIIWGNGYLTHLNKILLQQKRIIRIICNVPMLTHTQPLFHQTGILKIEDMYSYSCSIFSYKLIHSIFPTPFKNRFSYLLTPRNIQYFTRTDTNTVEIPFCKTTMRQRTIGYNLPKIYNNFLIPNDFLSSPSIHIFKRAIRTFLILAYL